MGCLFSKPSTSDKKIPTSADLNHANVSVGHNAASPEDVSININNAGPVRPLPAPPPARGNFNLVVIVQKVITVLLPQCSP